MSFMLHQVPNTELSSRKAKDHWTLLMLHYLLDRAKRPRRPRLHLRASYQEQVRESSRHLELLKTQMQPVGQDSKSWKQSHSLALLPVLTQTPCSGLS
jgi:hypothetical protein